MVWKLGKIMTKIRKFYESSAEILEENVRKMLQNVEKR